jgi:hypothetical protein
VSWADRLLFAEALWRLAAVRLMIVALPFRTVAKRLGQPNTETARTDDARRRELLRRVRWSVLAASRRAPWRCQCLEQAIAAKMMLRGRGVPATLYLGLARRDDDPARAIDAHAWLRCGTTFVTGGDGSRRFGIVSGFADEEQR